MTPGADAQAAVDESVRLVEQLRRIDEAVDTADGVRMAEPGDLQWRTGVDGRTEVLVDEQWYDPDHAIELTRAALHQHDLGLEAEGEL